MMNIQHAVAEKITESGANLILVHSDIMLGFPVPFTTREGVLSAHVNALQSLSDGLQIWMPAFNYDFCKGKDHNIFDTPSQVGILTEHFRRNIANWRTEVPVFSFSGTGKPPVLNIDDTIDPFGANSAFHHLYQHHAFLMHYGSQISSSTILHYAERMSGVLPYRYDKLFRGNVIKGRDVKKPVKFNFHVRPLNYHLDYDWLKIEKDLYTNNILISFKNEKTSVLLCSVRKLVDFFISAMQKDPLYLLDNESRQWVTPMLDKLGRKFLITDFEITNAA